MRKLFPILLLLLPLVARAEIVSADRLYIGWTNAGVIGGIPNSSNMTVFTNISAANAAAISSAIGSCPDGQVIQLEAGTFTMSTLDIQNNGGWVLRGAGKDQTILNFAGNLFRLRSDLAGNWPPQRDADASLTVNAAKDATTVTVDNPGTTAVGRFILFFQTVVTNDSTKIVIAAPNTHRTTAQSHLTTVTAINGNDVSFLDPLPFDLNTSQSAAFNAYAVNDKISDIGLENMTVTSTRGTAIEFWGAYNSWFKNVKLTRNNVGFILAFFVSSHCTVYDCEIIGSGQVLPNQFGIGSGSTGSDYITHGISACLFENNIIKNIFPFVELNAGSTANVIAYNYCPELSGSDMGINLNHGGHNSFNLVEGNLVANVKPDGYFGSTSHDTILRNRLTGLGAHAPIDLKRFTRYYNVVGNVLGTSDDELGYDITTSDFQGSYIYALGFPNIGNHTYTGTAEPSTGDWWADWATDTLPGGYQEYDMDVLNTLIRKGNYNYYNNEVPAGEALGGDTIPDSYYLTAKPTWFGNLTWPPYNPTSPVNSFADNKILIPAGYFDEYGAYPPTGPDTNAPALSTATINAAGTSISLQFNEIVSFGAGGNGGFTFALSGGAATLSYSSGSETATLIYSLSRSVLGDETVTSGLNYTNATGVLDVATNYLASFGSHAVINNSTYTEDPPVITNASHSFAVDIPASYQIVANNTPTSYTATNLPTGLSANTGTGLITGTPTVLETNSVGLSASNQFGATWEVVTFTVSTAVENDLFFGNTNSSGTTDGVGADDINIMRWQATSTVRINTMHAKVGTGTSQLKLAIYSDGLGLVPLDLLGETEIVSGAGAGWTNMAMVSEITLTNGQWYWIALWSAGASSVYYTTLTGGEGFEIKAGLPFGTWPNPITGTTTGLRAEYEMYGSGVAPAPGGAPSGNTMNVGTLNIGP